MKLTPETSNTYVLIVTYADRGEYVESLCRHLFTIGIKKAIIIDNCSTKRSALILDNIKKNNPEKIVVKHYSYNAGTAIAFKDAMQTAAADPGCSYIWILDDDNLPEPGAFDELTRVWANTQIDNKESMLMVTSFRRNKLIYKRAVCTGKPSIVTGEKNHFRAFHVAKVINMIKGKAPFIEPSPAECPDSGPIPAAPYGGMYFHKNMLSLIGYPDERFLIYSDDHEFSYRLTVRGGKIILCLKSEITDIEKSPNAQGLGIFHIHGHFNKTLLYYSIRNRVFLDLRINVNNYIAYLANAAIYTTAVFFFCLFTLNFANFLAFSRGLLDGLQGKMGVRDRYKL